MRTALITGATAGFGKAIAESLAKARYRLIITGRRVERLESLREELRSLTEVHIMPFDVRNKAEVITAFANLPGDWKNVDVLVNNAGLALGKSNLEGGLTEDWDQMMDTNVKGLLYVTKAATPLLKKSKNAHIINIGSIAGTEVYPSGNVYCASKYAVNALSKAMRIELLPYAIRVSQIRPGLADTEFSIVRYKGDKEKASQVYKGFDALQAEDIARAALFILESPRHVCINDLEITPTAQANAYLLEKNH
ncbi:MAG: 3-hydroxy acid dehydrogenase/malonic semialdehyde reductase [Cryomorphaceae bacterium]|jgi:3-hydroxy acid dehydrogenase/malonic semialdehyde reductase